MLFETALQHKSQRDSSAHTYLQAKIGAAYELKRESVDPALLAAPTRPFSNLLGEIAIHPTQKIHIRADGQYDHVQKFWATAHASLSVIDENDYNIKFDWQRTDARYATASELITADASMQLARRWSVFGSWRYDRLLNMTQQASGGIHYLHPCWNLRIEGYRNNVNGSAANSDFGFRFLLGFEGLGSVGS
jgi:lipopolysaccharide assembly outer membrane protein LptD (OstA)